MEKRFALNQSRSATNSCSTHKKARDVTYMHSSIVKIVYHARRKISSFLSAFDFVHPLETFFLSIDRSSNDFDRSLIKLLLTFTASGAFFQAMKIVYSRISKDDKNFTSMFGGTRDLCSLRVCTITNSLYEQL